MKSFSVNNGRAMQELFSNEKADISDITINITGNIFVNEPIIIKNCSDLTISADTNTQIFGGYTNIKWEKTGKLLSARLAAMPRMLIINDEVKKISQYPQNGYLKSRDECKLKWQNSVNGGWDKKPTHDELTKITVDTKDVPKNLDIKNCDIRMLHTWDESVVSIKDYDDTTGTIFLNHEAAHPSGAFERHDFLFLNTKLGISEPGTWYYDKNEKIIYYHPEENETAENITCFIPQSNGILRLENCKNITIENVCLSLSNSESGKIAGLRAINPLGAMCFNKCENIFVKNCTVEYSGGQGIKFLQCKNVNVSGCLIEKCASCGIVCLECENENINFNYIKDIGLCDFSAVSIHAGGKSVLPYVLDGKKEEKGCAVIFSNTIENSPYCGIVCSGKDHTIENNYICGCMQKLSDGAAIYCSRASNTKISDNYICGMTSEQSQGIYLDELSENCLIESNAIINVIKAFQNHLAKNTHVKNNIIINDSSTIITMSRSIGYSWENNIIFSNGDIEFDCKGYFGYSNTLGDSIGFSNDILFSENGKIICYDEIDCNKYGILNIDPKVKQTGCLFECQPQNGIQNKYITKHSEPHCIITKIIPEKEDLYRTLHKNIWDQVIKCGHLYNIRNYSIFKAGGYYISFFEYTGDDLKKDLDEKSKLPVIRRWKKLCDECYTETALSPELIFFNKF